jgi:predicted HTH transcriptional regulator
LLRSKAEALSSLNNHIFLSPFSFLLCLSKFNCPFGAIWLTTEVLATLGLNERQIRAVAFLKSTARITNADYQSVTGATRPTAKRDLEDLVKKRVVAPMGGGRGSYYELPGRNGS